MSKSEYGFIKKYALGVTGVIVLMMTFSFLWFSYNKHRLVFDSLQTAIKILHEVDNVSDDAFFREDFKNVRVTLLDAFGNVLADNAVGAGGGAPGNHADRPEFIMAQVSGYGHDVRRSETTGKRTVYVITKLKNGTHVRLAQSTELTYEFLLWLFAPIVFLSLCIGVLMFAFAKNKQIERLRHEFVANVSHELKTPLTSIKGFAELTATGLVRDVGAVKEYQQKIVAQSDRLLATINDIMHLSKLESTKPAELVPVDTRAIAEQVREALKLVADDKDIIIQVAGEGMVLAEVEPIYHLIYNLTDNGIKYGKGGGFVKIDLSGERITVSDDGIGIPEEDIERVFERFYRVDKSRSAQTGGTGLGLAIVKHTVQKYKGVVSIRSAVGGGTAVTVEFRR